MAKRPSRTRKQKASHKPRFLFHFFGFMDGWYALRADLSPLPGDERLASLTFENEVVEWLIETGITLNKHSWVGNGSIDSQGPFIPALADGSGLCVLLKRPADVLRFEQRFPCSGVTPTTILEALRQEAAVVRLSYRNIAEVAYEAYQKLNAIFGTPRPSWQEATDADRQMFLDGVKIRIEKPDITNEEIHQFWMDDRAKNGWRFGPVRDQLAKTHPSMIPYERLSPLEKAKDALFANIVAALASLLKEDA